MAEDRFDVVERWPELFEPLTDNDRRAVVQSLISTWQAGWEPNRETVQLLTRYVTGAITKDEYKRRSREQVERQQRERTGR